MKTNMVIAIAVAAVVVVAAVGVVIYMSGDGPSGTRNADEKFADMSWGDVLAEARGQTVNWYLWDGDVNVNSFIDNQVAAEAAKYGVTINRIGVGDMNLILSKVAAEVQAGKKVSGGSVDMAWLNGANFAYLKENDLLFGNEWAWTLPNTSLVDWNRALISSDMGLPTEGYESPWGTAQFQLIFSEGTQAVPASITDFTSLMAWVKANPGKFTYPSLTGDDAFYGLAFVKSLLYELEYDPTLGWKEYDPAAHGGVQGWERYTPDKWEGKTQAYFEYETRYVWNYLKEMEPNLYKVGTAVQHPLRSATNQLLKVDGTGGISLSYTYTSAGLSAEIRSGVLPATAKPIPMQTGVADTNYVLIPVNASSKAGAMVVANILLQPDMQAQWLTLTGNGVSISPDRLAPAQKDMYDDLIDRIPGSYLPDSTIEASAMPDVCGHLTDWMRSSWTKFVINGTATPTVPPV